MQQVCSLLGFQDSAYELGTFPGPEKANQMHLAAHMMELDLRRQEAAAVEPSFLVPRSPQHIPQLLCGAAQGVFPGLQLQV